jgi:hypothetical protein
VATRRGGSPDTVLSNGWFIDSRGQFIINNRRVFCADRQKNFARVVQSTKRRFEPDKEVPFVAPNDPKECRTINLPTH